MRSPASALCNYAKDPVGSRKRDKYRRCGFISIFGHLVAVLLLSTLLHAQQRDALVAGFENPANDARPLAYWQWLNGNVTEEGIRLDLDWMHRMGMGGVFMFDIAFSYPPVPQYVEDRIGFGSESWKRALRLAAEEANRLDLSFGMQSSGGWSVSGDPDVAPTDAMKKLVWSEIVVAAGKTGIVLPALPGASGPYQDYPARERDREPTLGGDIAVIAYRLPGDETMSPPSVQILGVAAPDLLLNNRYDEATAASPDAKGRVLITFTFPGPVTPAAFTLSIDGAIPEGKLVDAEGNVRATLPGPAQTGAAVRTFALAGAASQVWRLEFPRQEKEINVREARFDFDVRIDRHEEKAGFGTLRDYEAVRSDPAPGTVHTQTVIDISDKMTPDGTLNWRPDEGRWMVLRFGWSLTGKRVLPASPESRGFEVDKLDAGAVRAFATRFYDRLAEAIGPQGRMDVALTDSWEAGTLNWSKSLPANFQRLRGYDPLPWFPALTGRVVENTDASERFLADWRRTIADLIADNHYGVIADVLSARGITYYAEAPGTNMPTVADGLQARRRVAVPMGEYWYWPADAEPKGEHIADIREAASAAHIEGRRMVAAEALTTMGEEPWAMGPREWRRMVDRFFTEGVNRIVMHTSVHQPFTDRYPGMTLRQYGQHFTRNEAWAELADGWVSYLSRSSFMLQQGAPVADVAVFFGEDAAVSPPYDLSLRPPGYDMDYVDREALQQLAFQDGWIVTPAGTRYRVLMLRPDLRRMSMATLDKLASLASEGALIIGERPLGPIGLGVEASEFDRRVNRLWNQDGSGKRVEAGQVYAGVSAEQVLQTAGVQPDFTSKSVSLYWAHRRTADGDIYFISNQDAGAFDGKITLRAESAGTGALAETWHATTGRRNALTSERTPAGVKLNLALAPYASTFIVIRPGAKAPSALVPGTSLLTLDGPWQVKFPKGMGAPAETIFSSLSSWTEHEDPAIRYYSGRAVYRTTFEINDDVTSDAMLDLGEVGEMARVRINDNDLGVVWWSPARIEIGKVLSRGENTIEIEVANYWRNRLVGDRQPGATPYTFAPITPYDATTTLRPSGLIGPVKLILMHPDTGQAITSSAP